MNINFVTLFPDADGVAKYCNNSLISYYNLTNLGGNDANNSYIT